MGKFANAETSAGAATLTATLRECCAQCPRGTHRSRRQGCHRLVVPTRETPLQAWAPSGLRTVFLPHRVREVNDQQPRCGHRCSLCPCRNVLRLINEFDFPEHSISRDNYATVLTHLNSTQPERVAGLYLETCRLQDFLDKVLRGLASLQVADGGWALLMRRARPRRSWAATKTAR